MKNVRVNANKTIKQVHNFWNNIHFHPTDAIEDLWGQKILDSASADGAAKRVRIYAMLEDVVYEDGNGNLAYDFTDTDKRLDYMVSRGFDLLICMNFLPRAIAKDKTVVSANPRYKNKRLFTSVPADYKLWQEVCRAYIAHLVERYGEDTVSKWYFHCWNEANLPGFWMSNCNEWSKLTDEYLKLYDYFAEGIKSVSKKIKVGGPSAAFTAEPTTLPDVPKTDEYGPLVDVFFIKKFFNHVKSGKNFANGGIGTAFDFYSVHTYGDLYDCLRRNELDFKDCTDMLANYRKIADDVGFKDIEMISDEWEMCGGGWLTTSKYPILDYRNSEVFSSLYFGFIEDVIARGVDVSTIMICLSGQHDLTSDFAGTRTFATKSGFKLPIYNAYALAAMLGENILECECDDGIKAIPTMTDSGDIAVAVINYSKNPNKKRGTVNANISISVPSGKYTLTHYRLDKQNCNSYTVWKELGHPECYTQADIEKIEFASRLTPWYDSEEVSGDSITVSTQLPDYSVSLIKLTKNG